MKKYIVIYCFNQLNTKCNFMSTIKFKFSIKICNSKNNYYLHRIKCHTYTTNQN